MIGKISTMDRIVATAAVVMETTENTNRYVENIIWYPYYKNNDNYGEEQLPRILQAGSYGGSSSSSSSSSSSNSDYSSSSSSFGDDSFGSSSSSSSYSDDDSFSDDDGVNPRLFISSLPSFFTLVFAMPMYHVLCLPQKRNYW